MASQKFDITLDNGSGTPVTQTVYNKEASDKLFVPKKEIIGTSGDERIGHVDNGNSLLNADIAIYVEPTGTTTGDADHQTTMVGLKRQQISLIHSDMSSGSNVNTELRIGGGDATLTRPSGTVLGTSSILTKFDISQLEVDVGNLKNLGHFLFSVDDETDIPSTYTDTLALMSGGAPTINDWITVIADSTHGGQPSIYRVTAFDAGADTITFTYDHSISSGSVAGLEIVEFDFKTGGTADIFVKGDLTSSHHLLAKTKNLTTGADSYSEFNLSYDSTNDLTSYSGALSSNLKYNFLFLTTQTLADCNANGVNWTKVDYLKKEEVWINDDSTSTSDGSVFSAGRTWELTTVSGQVSYQGTLHDFSDWYNSSIGNHDEFIIRFIRDLIPPATDWTVDNHISQVGGTLHTHAGTKDLWFNDGTTDTRIWEDDGSDAGSSLITGGNMFTFPATGGGSYGAQWDDDITGETCYGSRKSSEALLKEQFDIHRTDTVMHVTQSDKDRWDASASIGNEILFIDGKVTSNAEFDSRLAAWTGNETVIKFLRQFGASTWTGANHPVGNYCITTCLGNPSNNRNNLFITVQDCSTGDIYIPDSGSAGLFIRGTNDLETVDWIVNKAGGAGTITNVTTV